MNACGRGRILNELHQIILENDLPRSDREVLPHLEGRHVRLPDAKEFAGLVKIFQKLGHAPGEILRAGRNRGANHLGI